MRTHHHVSRLLHAHAGSEAGWGLAVLARLAAAVAHHLAVDGAAHAVVQLGVQLGQGICLVHARLLDVTHGRRLHDVADHELLDALVLGHAARAVGAAHRVGVPAALLVAPVVASLQRHLYADLYTTLLNDNRYQLVPPC